MTVFRPCIDLHEGRVKQIVGGSLRDSGTAPETNFVAEQSAGYFAGLYRDDGLPGGHVIRLGQGNDDAAQEALAAWPGGLQLGGGINADNAEYWLEQGAAKVIVTSWLFEAGRLSLERAQALLIQGQSQLEGWGEGDQAHLSGTGPTGVGDGIYRIYSV